MHTFRTVVCKFFYSHASQHNLTLNEPLKKATQLTEGPLPVHSKSNMKLDITICLSFMYITCKNHQRLTPD